MHALSEFCFHRWCHSFQHWVPPHLAAVYPSCSSSTGTEQAPAVCETAVWLTHGVLWFRESAWPQIASYSQPC